jgi:membrane protein required for colicin V production
MSAAQLTAVSWVDWVLLAVLTVSVFVGIARGFVFEVLALLGWVAAWFAAQWLAPGLAPHLPIGTPGGGLNLGAAFAIGFVAALVVWGLAARLIRMSVRATPLSIADRLLGAAFGALRGGVLLLAAAVAVALTPAAQSTPWRHSQGAHWLGQALGVLTPLLPESMARRVPGTPRRT